MSSSVQEPEKKRIIKLLTDLVTSREKIIDEIKLKSVKKLCKTSEDCLLIVHSELYNHLKKNNADIRLLCLEVVDELFTRSHLFRNLTIDRFEELTILCTGVDSLKPLPLPKLAAKQLQSKSIQTFKKWIDSFVEGYPKLKVIYEALKRRVNFSTATLLNDVDEMRREAEREREASLWRGRVIQVEKEVTENQDCIDQCIQETKSCIELWQDGGSPGLQDVRTVSLCDQYNILYKRLIPLCKAWTVTLTKAGRHTQHDLLRKCVEMKRSLDSVFDEIVKLGINFDKFNSSRTVEETHKSKFDEAELFSDPTTLAANVKKYNAEFPSKPDFLAGEGSSTTVHSSSSTAHSSSSTAHSPSTTAYSSSTTAHSSSTSSQSSSSSVSTSQQPSHILENKPCSSTSERSSETNTIKTHKYQESSENKVLKKIDLKNVPVIKLSELVSEYTVERDMDLGTVWLNGERSAADRKAPAPGIKRVITLSGGEFEPVTRSCRFPLETGSLCPRRDRVKCPFHGLIINRDTEGNPEEVTITPSIFDIDTATTYTDPTEKAESVLPQLLSTVKKKKVRKSTKLLSNAKETDSSRTRLGKRVFNKAAVKRVARTLDAQDLKRAKSLFSEQHNYVNM